MRELNTMAEARQEADWERASWIMHTIANFSFGNEEHWTPDDFNPIRIAEKQAKERHLSLDEVFNPLIESGSIEVRRNG
ncbi:MAG: hypothetical protein IJJ33_15820 [Victivallales bacterium]|nr:hypothetical protein [Victivallales bacterium]